MLIATPAMVGVVVVPTASTSGVVGIVGWPNALATPPPTMICWRNLLISNSLREKKPYPLSLWPSALRTASSSCRLSASFKM